MGEKGKTITIWILIFAVIILLVTRPEEKTKIVYKDKPTTETVAKVDEKQETKPIEHKEYIFENGNFTAGIDFEPGDYNIKAIQGYGNVSSFELCNMMGTKEEIESKPDYRMVEEYKNVRIKKDERLKVDRVKVKITRVR